MKIAIIGAGFSGLATCYHLLNQEDTVDVTLFDPKGVGGEASSVSSGLLHPYPGKWGKLNWRGFDGMAASSALIKASEEALGMPVAKRTGIIRFACDEKQAKSFQKTWGQTEYFFSGMGGKPAYEISSGITVFSSLYLEGLWQSCARMGAKLIKEKASLEKLHEYDAVILAAGRGIFHFDCARDLPLAFTKGQTLKCEMPSFLGNINSSLIGRGHLALSHEKNICYLGSTYEHSFITDAPCMGTACDFIMPRIAQFIPYYSHFKVLQCLSGIRVVNKKVNLPLVGKIDSKVWVITAMGSRGLLYHSLLGKELAKAVLSNDEAQISSDVRI